MKILTLTKLPEEQVTALNNAGYEVIHAAIRDLSDAELVDIDIIYGVDEFLNDILLGIDAKTYEGNVTVRDSSGAMSLETTTGNIVAFQSAARSSGDFFRARTIRGAITLQQIGYRDTEINSSSGTITYIGKILSGGQYYFGSSNSSITLAVPEDTSAKIIAVYGYGRFSSQLPLKDLKPGDEVVARATGLGALRNRVAPAS